MKTFVDTYEGYARHFPNKPAIVFGKNRDVYTWKEFDERANSLANTFLDLGVKRDDRVALSLYNGHEVLESFYACWKIAAAPVTVLYRYYKKELSYVIDKCDATTVVFEEDLIDRISNIKPDLKKVKNYIVVGEKTPEGMYNYEELIKKYPKTKPEFEWEPLNEKDVCLHLMTGGTTGMPKGVIFSQRDTFVILQRAMLGGVLSSISRIGRAPKDLFDGIDNIVPGSGKLLYSIRPIMRQPAVEKLMSFIGRKIPYDLFTQILSFLPYLTSGRLNGAVANPIVHAGAGANVTSYTAMGATMHLSPVEDQFDANEFAKMIEQERINLFTVVGDSTLKPLLDAVEEKHYDTSSVFMMTSEGAEVSVSSRRRIAKLFPTAMFLDLFSSTEAWMTGMEVYTAGAAEEEAKKPTFRITPDIRIVDERGEDVKPGEVGEVITPSEIRPETMYYKEPDEKVEKTFKIIDGRRWTFMGDKARVSEDGKRFSFVGRGSLCVNTGGEKVFVEEVEDLIGTNPKVEKVGVTGVPDEKWGEAVTAVIQLKEGEKGGEEEIREFCRGKIAGYKVPKHVIFVDEVPVSALDKIEYKSVKEIALKELGYK